MSTSSASLPTEDNIHLRRITGAGLLVTLGIIFGDIGTSPLYVFQTIMGSRPVSELLVYGGVSAVFWTLTLQTTIKYILLTLEADNHGEGGIFSLFSLVKSRGKWLLFPAIIGAGTLLADGIITPPISVSSAIEGLKIIYPALTTETIVIIVLIIITLLFAFQQFGTKVVGAAFGPIMLVWFSTIGTLGLIQIAHHPGVLAALNPLYAIRLLTEYPEGFWLLGAVFLCTTGAEALYSDLGHCGRKNIRTSWVFVKTALVLNYLGQAAWTMGHVGQPLASNQNPFFMIAPQWALVPLIILATMATIIASQALISGSYTLISEAVSLRFWPKVRVLFPTDQRGQIYVPSINWLLWFGCVCVQLWFKTSEAMTAAYGFSITVAMLMTSLLLSQYLRGVKHWSIPVVMLIMLVFFTVESSFLIANITKLLNRLGILVFEWGLIFMMYVGYKGREIKNSLLSLVPVASTLPTLQELSDDQSVSKYASNLVYLTHSKKTGELENEILYSILRKQPKRADRYWFINMSILSDPYSTRYSVEELVPRVAYKINFKLGFRVQPRLNLLFRRVLEEMGERGEIDITSRYDSLSRHNMPGDFRFVVLEKVLSHDNQLTLRERFILNGYFFINRFAISDQQLFGLDTSDVALEKVPLTVKPVSRTFDLKRDPIEQDELPVNTELAASELATQHV
ncbi:MAG: KUP/HAK/KT family potassium transporter [Janthinobacterium lividum]